MAAILIHSKNVEKQVWDLIYDKQLEFRKEKGRRISLEQTIAKLLKEAYLKK